MCARHLLIVPQYAGDVAIVPILNDIDIPDRSVSDSAIMRSPKYADSDCREKQRLGLGLGARGDLGRQSQRLCVDVLLDSHQLAVSNGDVEDPLVLERLIRSFDLPRSEADDQNPVSLRNELRGPWVCRFKLF